MVTSRIGPKKPKRARYLFIKEWMDERGLDDTKMAGRLGVARETVNRWRNDQRGIKPEKQAQIAHALDLEPTELWRPPSSRPSIDALLRDASDDLQAKAYAIVKMLKTGT